MAKQDEVRLVTVPAGSARLEGILALPENAHGVVAFVHGSGSSRHSPRNRFVAESLRSGAGVGTLLFDLLSKTEESEDARTARLRFDIELLAARVEAATAWLHHDGGTSGLPIGYFGASTGAAAALVAAARRPREVAAVVSRGGRPDLAGPEVLARVRAPTLLIVGGEDLPVIDMNREALRMMRTECRLDVVPDASHLFEEPGALEQVARCAAGWVKTHLVALALAAGMLLAALLVARVSYAHSKHLMLTPVDFANGQGLSPQFTCDGPGTSPGLSWSNVPPGTQSFALVVHDPDAPSGDFAHWIVYDIPANTTGIPEGAASKGELPAGAVEGTNGRGSKGWTPPCPPSGTHHYRFELYALDMRLPAMETATEPALFAAMRGHVLDRAQVVATYEKSH
jgi:putative phosphoribosyl transferase